MDISFVCVGQCAGNFGVLLEQRGFNVLYINTAEGDLATLGSDRQVFHVPNSVGCNQNQDKAKAALASSLNDIISAIDKCVTSRIVYFVCSAGGGTGGGMSPLLWEAFMQHVEEVESNEWESFDKQISAGVECIPPASRKVGMITVAPGIKETVQINANAYNFYRDVVELVERNASGEFQSMASIFIIDNDNSPDPTKLNAKFVDLLHEVLQIPKTHLDVRGNVDEADLETALVHPGVCILGKCGPTGDTISLCQSISNSAVFAPSEGKIGVYWLTSTVAPIDVGLAESRFGMPLAHFKAYNKESNYFLISGLGFPFERFDIMAERAKEYRTSVETKVHESSSAKMQQDLGFLNSNFHTDLGLNKSFSPTTRESVTDKLNRFRRRSV